MNGQVKISKELLRTLIFGSLMVELDDMKLDLAGNYFVATIHGPDVPENDGLLRVQTTRSIDTKLVPAS
jgi:hypothetical protein